MEAKKISEAINFCKNLCLLVITWNKKHSSKHVIPTTYMLKKRVFAAATFKGLCVVVVIAVVVVFFP